METLKVKKEVGLKMEKMNWLEMVREKIVKKKKNNKYLVIKRRMK